MTAHTFRVIPGPDTPRSEDLHRRGCLTGCMLTVVLIVLAVAGVWALVSISVAFLAGGMIHARDHVDVPGALSRPVASLASARSH